MFINVISVLFAAIAVVLVVAMAITPTVADNM